MSKRMIGLWLWRLIAWPICCRRVICSACRWSGRASRRRGRVGLGGRLACAALLGAAAAKLSREDVELGCLHKAVALATMPADELAAAAGISVAEALAEKRLAAIAVLPYLHRRKPQDVNVNTRQHVTLIINDEGADVIDGDASDIVGIVEYQQVSEVPDGQV